MAPSDPKRVYATVDAGQTAGGIYRSDDAGETWERATGDRRAWARGSDFAEIDVDPINKDIVYSSAVEVYKSTDGAKTFTGFKGAPGGDDYHTMWINPDNPKIMLLAVDQGAVVTVNGGETWSSWYNQPTAQFYHVITDNQFLTGSTEANRRAALQVLRAEVTTVRSHFVIGEQSVLRSTVTSHLIR